MTKYFLIIAALLVPCFASAQGISQLQQFTSTTSPINAITQAVYGKAFRLSGQTTGCAEFSANGTLTTTGQNCGGSGSSAFEIATTSSIAVPQLAYFTRTGGRTTLGGTATGTLSASSPLSLSGVTTIVGSSRTLTIDTSGTWTGNAVTATALAANGMNASAGNAILGVDASGNAEGAFDVWTEAENTAAAYAAQATTLTIAGTANQITSSAAAQSLAANRTWTLSFPTLVVFPGAASSTALSALDYLYVGRTSTTTIRADGIASILPYASTTAVSAVSANVSGTLTAATLLGALDAGGATSFEIPNATSPTVDAVGEIALDTTSGNLVLATSTDATSVVLASATTTLYAFMASTTQLVSGSVIDLPAHYLPQVVTGVICKVSSGTSFVINLSNAAGSSDTNTMTCTTTETQYAITSNKSFAAYGGIRLEFGTKTGDTGNITVRIIGYRKTD